MPSLSQQVAALKRHLGNLVSLINSLFILVHKHAARNTELHEHVDNHENRMITLQDRMVTLRRSQVALSHNQTLLVNTTNDLVDAFNQLEDRLESVALAIRLLTDAVTPPLQRLADMDIEHGVRPADGVWL